MSTHIKAVGYRQNATDLTLRVADQTGRHIEAVPGEVGIFQKTLVYRVCTKAEEVRQLYGRA